MAANYWTKKLPYEKLNYLTNENDTQLNYSTNEKEMLVVVFGVEKFPSYFIGCKTIVLIDHTALKYFFTKKKCKDQTNLLRIVFVRI